MSARLPAAIAWRYLFSKKSHSAVSAIITVSIIGVAVATAAIVCVLSVFNGFHHALSDKLDLLSPDILVSPSSGKTIPQADSLAAEISKLPGVEIAMPSVTDNALAIMNEREIPITLKGVKEEDYRRISKIDEVMLYGMPFVLTDSVSGTEVWDDDMQEFVTIADRPGSLAMASIGAASRLGASELGQTMFLFVPKRKGRLNPANPLNSFFTDSVSMAGVWQSNQAEYDKDMVIVPLEVARRLFDYTTEATGIEVKGAPNSDMSRLANTIAHKLGNGYVVEDRLAQHQLNFRMINIEKWVTFMLLAFILVVASFNLISTLSMLILEKQHALSTLHSMGMTRRMIGNVFGWESAFVTLIGALSGIILGVVLVLIQQEFGLIKLNGDESMMVMTVYPVRLKLSDLFLVLLPIGVIGYITALVSSSFAKARVD